jgi:Mg-chelatase subunit ChlD
MKFLLIPLLFFIIAQKALAQNSLIEIDQATKDIGIQENIYKVKADYIITNHQAKNLYLLRADAEKGVTIHTSKKTLKPNDTALILIEFIPKNTGKFNEGINLITSADGLSFKLSLSGNIKSIKTDDKTACFYFKKPNSAGVKTIEPMVVVENTKPRDNSNKIPDNSSEYPTRSETVVPTKTITSVTPADKHITVSETKTNTKPTNNSLLNEALYKPNNIIFLVDVSSSMSDTSKLKVMQNALHYLISVLRPTDKISFITYADTVKLLRDGISGNNKEDLNTVVSKLKARGGTKGKKAILYGLDLALKNYIPDGNNQLLLATDGKFRFYSEDQQIYAQKRGDKLIKLTTIAFGNDKDAIKNLKEIAEIGKGNFIHIKNRHKAQEQLLEEIKENSLIQ